MTSLDRGAVTGVDTGRSSCTVTAHLSPLVDYADLNGNLLIANDPYRGVTVKDGKLVVPNRPGLGLEVLKG